MATAMAPVRRRRAKPGAKGGGRFFHIELRPRKEFVAFRMQAFGGGLERLAGRRADGSWDTAAWLIGKDRAHIERGRLVADSVAAENMLKGLGSAPVHLGGDRFRAKPRRRIPKSAKPTAAMRRAALANIKKAQAAQRKQHALRARRAARAATSRSAKA